MPDLGEMLGHGDTTPRRAGHSMNKNVACPACGDLDGCHQPEHIRNQEREYMDVKFVDQLGPRELEEAIAKALGWIPVASEYEKLWFNTQGETVSLEFCTNKHLAQDLLFTFNSLIISIRGSEVAVLTSLLSTIASGPKTIAPMVFSRALLKLLLRGRPRT